jgi:hypothetical protein
MTREQMDQIAWTTIHSRPPFSGQPGWLAPTHRPANYQEL